MCFINNQLYCGTNNGAVFVLKRLTLTPLFSFNAHVQRVYNLCPIIFETTIPQLNENNNQTTDNRFTSLKEYQSFNSNVPFTLQKPLLPLQSANTTKQHCLLVSIGRALAPYHEDVYLTSSLYRFEVLKNYANCLFLCAWDCNDN